MPSKILTQTPRMVSVKINPVQANLLPLQRRQQFSAKVEGAAKKSVIFTILEGPSAGSISQTGNKAIYTAPRLDPDPKRITFHIVATSVADPTKSATATVTVLPR